MQDGFSTLATASATLLGLVLVAVVFAYRSTFTRLDRIADFKDLARWIWTSGFSCFLYFGICLLVSFRMMEKETSKPALVIILAFFSVVLIVTHVFETRFLHKMARYDPPHFRGIVIAQDLLVTFVLVFFEVYIWYAVAHGSAAVFQLELYTALSYTLFFASFRSVALVIFSFRAITILETEKGDGEPA
jgi:membrane-associated HD superfamily phosphohydrolase